MATKNNGIQLTEAEEAEHEAAQTSAQAHEQVLADAKAQKEAVQASGNQKLLDLGLSQAEATALTNYTPPEDEL